MEKLQGILQGGSVVEKNNGPLAEPVVAQDLFAHANYLIESWTNGDTDVTYGDVSSVIQQVDEVNGLYADELRRWVYIGMENRI